MTTNTTTPNPLLTVRQVAARLNVSTTAIYDLISAGSLPCYRIGAGEKRQRIRIAEADIAEYLERQRLEIRQPILQSSESTSGHRRRQQPTPNTGFVHLRRFGFKK